MAFIFSSEKPMNPEKVLYIEQTGAKKMVKVS